MYLRPGGELVLLDEEDIHGTMGFINSEQTLKSGSQGVIKTPISLPVSSKLRHFHSWSFKFQLLAVGKMALKFLRSSNFAEYHKAASINTSCIEVLSMFYRLFVKGRRPSDGSLKNAKDSLMTIKWPWWQWLSNDSLIAHWWLSDYSQRCLFVLCGLSAVSHAHHSTYSWNIKWQKCARMGLNGFIFKKLD